MLKSVQNFRKVTPSRTTNFADPEGIKILHDLESFVLDSPAETPRESNVVTDDHTETWKKPSIICVNLSADASGSEYSVDNSELCDRDEESHEDNEESDAPFDEKKERKLKKKGSNTRLLVEKGTRHFTFDNICTPSNCAVVSPSSLTTSTPTMGNKYPVKEDVDDVSVEKCTGEPNDLILSEEPQPTAEAPISPARSVKNIVNKIEGNVVSTSPPALPIVSPESVRRTPQNITCDTGNQIEHDFQVGVRNMKPLGDESSHQLLHKNYRKSDE